jgi:nucleoside-diphosphate-sugar epimerase
MKRVLVTGASGCVGRHAIDGIVARGYDVHAITSREPAGDAPGVTWHRADLLEAGVPAQIVDRVRPTHLLHMAWYIAPGRWASAPENFAWVQASLELLRAFGAAGGQRVVGAGSCLEYDWAYGYCSEERTPLRPHTAYGVCKNALQTLTTALGPASGFSSTWGRIFFLYGPHEHPDRLVPAVVRALLSGEPARCSHGRQVRDYLYVQDVADAFVELLDGDVTGPVNIASGEPIELRTIVRRTGELIGRPELVRLGAIPAAATDTPLVVADVTHAREAMPWRPRVGLDEGLSRTIDWWRGRLHATEARESWTAS